MNVLFMAVLVASVGAKLFPEFAFGGWLRAWSEVLLGLVVFYRVVKLVGWSAWKEIVAAMVSGLMLGKLICALARIVIVSFPAVFRREIDVSD